MSTPLGLLAIAALVAGNAFFVLAEYALVTARRSALEQRAEDGSRGARRALMLMDDPVRVIGTVQVAITGLGILLGAVGEPVLRDLVDPAFPTWLAFAFAFLTVTYLSVAFGELVPKALALHTADRFAALVAIPIDLLGKVLTPAVSVLQASARLVLRPLGVRSVTAGERPVSREELRAIVEDAEDAGALRAEEEDMLTGVIDLRVRRAADIMVPWEEIEVADVDAPIEEVVRQARESTHTRLPAVRDGGTVVGMLHVRDVWRAVADGGTDVRELVRPVAIIPPSLAVDRLLRELRATRRHLAVVVDEYGRPLGVATLEDVLEEIVGEIEDELDLPSVRVRPDGEGTWLVDAGCSVSDLNRATDAGFAGRANSVGGLLVDALGRTPAVGERVEVEGGELEAVAVEEHRVLVVRVRPVDAPDPFSDLSR